MNPTSTENTSETSSQGAAQPPPAELPSGPDPRLQSALALDVVRRTVRYGLRCQPTARGPRYLRATCEPWLARVHEDSLEVSEREALVALRSALLGPPDADPVGPSVVLLRQLEDVLVPFDGLLELADAGSALEPRAVLLPEGESERSRAMRERQEAEEARRRAQAAPPPPRAEPATQPPAERVERKARNERSDRSAAAADPTPREGASEAAPSDEPSPAPDAAHATSQSREEPRRGRGRRSKRGRDSSSKSEHESARAVEKRSEPPPPPPRPIRHPEGGGVSLDEFAPSRQTPLVEALRPHGVVTVADLLLLLPVRYELLPRAVAPSELAISGQKQVLRGDVIRRLTRLSPLGSRHEVVVGDGQAEITCRWITHRDLAFWSAMAPGNRVALFGLVETEGETTLLHEAELVWVDSRGQGRQACYDLEGVSEPDLRVLIDRALEDFGGRILDPLPDDVRKRLRLLGLDEALRRLHFPTHGASRGRERMAFDELLLYQLGHQLGQMRQTRERGIAHPIKHRLVSQVMAVRSQHLSDGQEIAFSEIRRDLARPRPMNRLLQGEVGVGKGFVALLTSIVVAEGRSQVVFLAPDALAAEHRFLFAEPLLRSVGLVPTLILDKPDAPQADALRRGEIHIAFATPAITRAWPGFKKLGLVIVEEREAYGTVALTNLPSQGTRPDLLVLTDAPIPTSIALTVFAHMDLSLVPGQLVEGLEVTAYPWSEHLEAYRRAGVELEAGRQIYVVLPMIGGRERLEQRELARFADALRGDAFPGARIGVFSGKMSREERHRTYQDFLHRRIDVLLTTTIIEDGPSVPNATTTVVLEADRFDLVRLHRLRAHVARGVRAGRCLFVLSEQPDPEGVQLVELMVREHDAFRIAEMDLVARGAEALLGERAVELPAFRYMDPLEHRDLLVRARSEAFELLEDPTRLNQPAYDGLRAALEESWQRWFPSRPVLGKKRQSTRKRSGRRRRRRTKK